jgi:autophagy-related protein 16-1
MSNDWQSIVASRLKQRDIVERDCFTTLITSHKLLQKNNEHLKNRIVLISQSGEGGGDTALKQENVELKEKVQKLTEDLLQKYKTEAQISTSERSANQESEALQAKLNLVTLEFSQKKEQYKISEEKVAQLMDKMNSQESQLMLYRGELKRLRQTRDESDKKVQELTKDNQTLLQRMLEDKQRLSEELNQMNILYERLRQQGGNGESNSTSNGERKEQTSNNGSSSSNSGNMGNGNSGNRSSGITSVVPKQATRWTKAHETKVNSVVCSPDGTKFATCSDDGTVKLWLTDQLKKGPTGMLRQSRSNKSPIMSIDWLSNYIVGGSTDRVATLWDVRTEREHVRLTGHKGKVLACKFVGQSARHVATGSADASIRLWDTRQGFTTRTIGCSSVCNCIDVAADGFTCTSGHLDGLARTWDLRNGKIVHEIRGIHEMPITSVQFSPSTSNASLLLTLSRENKMRVFDSVTWELIKTMEDEKFTVGSTSTRGVFSSDALYAAAGDASGAVYVWDVTTGSIVETLEKHQSVVTGMAWSKNGRLLFSTDQRGYVVVWA